MAYRNRPGLPAAAIMAGGFHRSFRALPLARRPRFEWPITFPMTLPSGQDGLRWNGHPVTVEIDAALHVSVLSPSSGRRIDGGPIHLGDVFWDSYALERDAPRELCDTARDMVSAAAVDAVRAGRRRRTITRDDVEPSAVYELEGL